MPKEIERKYLIEYPDIKRLAEESVKIIGIKQTYLFGKDGEDRRLRKSREGDTVVYTHTVKTRISKLTREETERVIGIDEYMSLLRFADPEFNPIEKIRYCIPTADGHTAEVDVYKNITDYAICEIELDNETESPMLPDCLRLVREVTGEKLYTNRYIALASKD